MTTLTIADRTIGPDSCFVIGEVAQAHDGSLGMAHAFVDAIADAGADAVKFQTHIAEAESTRAEPWRVRFSPQDETRYDYWKRMEFTAEQWRGLQQHSEERGLVFLSSPFSVEAVDLLARLQLPAWKIASGEVSNCVLLERIAATGRPALLSSGMSCWRELDEAVAFFRGRSVPLALFQCTTAYPCPPEQVGLSVLGEMQDRYGCPVGLSDHSGTIFPGLAAAALGAALLELHVTMSRRMFGPDVPASLTPRELKQLVEGVRFIKRSLAHPLDKDQAANQMGEMRTTFGRSVVLRVDLPVGAELQAEHLTVKKPGGGLPPHHLNSLIGRRLTRPARANQPLAEEMLQD